MMTRYTRRYRLPLLTKFDLTDPLAHPILDAAVHGPLEVR